MSAAREGDKGEKWAVARGRLQGKGCMAAARVRVLGWALGQTACLGSRR